MIRKGAICFNYFKPAFSNHLYSKRNTSYGVQGETSYYTQFESEVIIFEIHYKRATSNQGVVVIDEILHHKSRLQLETSSKEEKLKSLRELGKKIPPRHVMLSTKIGRVINKLRNHTDDEIQKAAKAVYVKWKTHFVEHVERPMMEVQCDLKTERIRTTGKRLLTEALDVQTNNKLPEVIERETFHSHNRRITNSYKRTLRHLVFTLKNQEEMRSKVLSGEITVTDFVKDNKKS